MIRIETPPSLPHPFLFPHFRPPYPPYPLHPKSGTKANQASGPAKHPSPASPPQKKPNANPRYRVLGKVCRVSPLLSPHLSQTQKTSGERASWSSSSSASQPESSNLLRSTATSYSVLRRSLPGAGRMILSPPHLPGYSMKCRTGLERIQGPKMLRRSGDWG